MAGLFGFFLLEARDHDWARARFAAMAARMTRDPRHRQVAVRGTHAWVGQSGPGILPGSLAVHGPPSESQLVAEGECYHLDDRRRIGEAPGGPWQWVRQRWLGGGAAALAEVDGLFTLALLHHESPRLQLINDRYGSRRLYLLETKDAVVFASELGPMLAWDEARAIDETFVRQSVCLGSALDDRTWCARVRLMPPATEIEVTPAGISSRRYWRWEDLPPADPAPAGAAGMPDSMAEAIRACWRRALAARLAGERVGQQLSGGLDSRVILADASEMRSGMWAAVTYGEDGSDEVRFAARAARAAGVPWVHLALPEPDWLEARTRFCLAHDGVVDIVNAFQATMMDRIASLMTWEVSGYLGDLVLGSTYEVTTAREAMSCLPYWHSPIAIPEQVAWEAIDASVGAASPRGWLIETKCRRAINAWPQTAVNQLEVRKPFVDYALVEHAAALPRIHRDRHDVHRVLLAPHPGIAAVPWQKTGVALGASAASLWATRATRVAYRATRSVVQTLGGSMRPWIRGAVQLDGWLASPTVEATLRETLLSKGSRVRAIFSGPAVEATLQATLRDRSIAHEPLLHLYRAERMLAHLADWTAGGEPPSPHVNDV